MLVFMGGADVSPWLYGEEILQGTNTNLPRDRNDLMAWNLGRNKFKVGICRGAQFLNIMSGGRMWQHVDGHTRDHLVCRYVFDTNDHKVCRDMKQYKVTSTHHQMMIPGEGGYEIGHALMNAEWDSMSLCREKKAAATIDGSRKGLSMHAKPDGSFVPVPMAHEDGHRDADPNTDSEMIWYPKTRSLCVQGHPEYPNASKEFQEDFLEMVAQYYEAEVA